MFSHRELGSDPPIGSDQESGRDTIFVKFIPIDMGHICQVYTH